MSITTVTILEMSTLELRPEKFITWSKNRGLFSILPQHSVPFLATLCCKLMVICLFRPTDGNDRGQRIAVCSLLYPSMENSARPPVGIKWSRARERSGHEVGQNEVPSRVFSVFAAWMNEDRSMSGRTEEKWQTLSDEPTKGGKST